MKYFRIRKGTDSKTRKEAGSMEWPGRKLAAFGMLLLLFGAAPALACNSEAPHSHEWPGGVDSPRPMPSREIRHQLQILLANRDKWDLAPKWNCPVYIAVLDMDWNGRMEIVANAQDEGIEYGYEVQPETGDLKKIPRKQLIKLLNNLIRASAQFTIMPANRQDWLQKEPARVIHMLRDSYENYAGIKEGFG
jgi:hypothetical protein